MPRVRSNWTAARPTAEDEGPLKDENGERGVTVVENFFEELKAKVGN